MNKSFSIGDRIIGDGQPAFIVAEIGLNHNGSIELAKKLIRKAKECGADAVKFQKRDLKSIYKPDIYQDPNKDSQGTAYLIDMVTRFELSEKKFIEIKKYCDKLDIIFFCTPWDIKSVDLLEKINVQLYKVASADLTNIPLIKKLIQTKKPLIVSTGMAQETEVDYTVKLLNDHKVTFALLHCVSAYPPAFKDINLNMIDVLKEKYPVPIGYSGHERGITVAICAVAKGAKIIEKHFTLDRSMEGSDHNISLMPEGFAKMVDRIRMIELALGDGKKTMVRGEMLYREILAKSLVAMKTIKKGQKISKNDIGIKSPGKGLSPQLIDSLIGKAATRDIKKYDYFTHRDILHT